MAKVARLETDHYREDQRESAAYIADLLLGLRKTAKRSDLSFLSHLLEMAFYEAYTIAKQVEPDMSIIETINQISEIS